MAVTEFQGEFRFLSNFWACTVAYDDVEYPSCEHAFQAAKTLDSEEREEIRCAQTPGQAKRLGRTATMRPEWDATKVQVMEDLVRQKFTVHPALREKLLATGESLLQEGNAWKEDFWGMVRRRGAWVGQNHLGKILMKVRAELRRNP